MNSIDTPTSFVPSVVAGLPSTGNSSKHCLASRVQTRPVIFSSSSSFLSEFQQLSLSSSNMGFRNLLRERANSLRFSRPRLRPLRTLTTPRLSPINVRMNVNENHSNNAGQNYEDANLPVQGPSQAPTEAGVSTAGLNELETSLLESSYNSDIPGIQKAIDSGVDINVSDINGRTCLHFCAGSGLHTLIRDLSYRGANLNKQDLLGFTPLHMASGYKRTASVRALLDMGADANIASNDGRLPVEIVEQLLERTPKKRFFMDNPDYSKIKEIVTLLDQATEIEDDNDDIDVHDEYEYVNNEVEEEDDNDRQGKRLGSEVLNQTREKTEKVGSTTFTVRVKSSDDSKTKKPKTNLDNVDVKITVKEPGSGK